MTANGCKLCKLHETHRVDCNKHISSLTKFFDEIGADNKQLLKSSRPDVHQKFFCRYDWLMAIKLPLFGGKPSRFADSTYFD
jgi:hypothetical protein